MKRAHGVEELHRIQAYFPGAIATTLEIPRDFMQHPVHTTRQSIEKLCDTRTEQQIWKGGVLWMS